MRISVPSAHQIGVASLCSAALLTMSGTTTQAACFTTNGCHQNGLTFSEASSSFSITNVTGLGTQTNPFVIYQDVQGLDISLAIDGFKDAQHHAIFNRPGFAISIVSRNLTGAFWRFYDHELQETAGQSSGENDGLSFAQGIGPIRPYASSHYDQADEVTDVRDFINFHRGEGVKPGETARFDYYITDTIPNQRFYIRQRPDYRPNTVPTAPITKLATPPQTPEPVPTVQTPITEPSVTNKPPSEIPTHVAKNLEKSRVKPQSVPEPSTMSMGLLGILLGKWQRDAKSARKPQPKK
ncbi:PEP-CTERM sorting domain-containing protein [Leptothoe spongobia]|uniref:PEP-CTERM sorting domain-containing protein n=1 Tax=Leptothoe spongobia TAU-MAC 1115 TaxID=1967444 RepID=A0A947DDH1_9CYAN|nr:PEP-CTERM sorting domain-containing protein [Leptothoe spongobia]MBT9314987.1 PEP-CTERM sorting domain-containing protein [Leptothoe spongobia TAU-MAC 1115]